MSQLLSTVALTGWVSRAPGRRLQLRSPGDPGREALRAALAFPSLTLRLLAAEMEDRARSCCTRGASSPVAHRPARPAGPGTRTARAVLGLGSGVCAFLGGLVCLVT